MGVIKVHCEPQVLLALEYDEKFLLLGIVFDSHFHGKLLTVIWDL